MTNRQTRGRLTLLAIAAAFALPIIAAVTLYFSPDGWRPAGKTVLGELIDPPRTLPAIALDNSEPAAQFREVWSLIVPAGSSCDQVCLDALVKIRQLRLWLGPKMTRMQTVFVAEHDAVLTPDVLAEHPRLIIPGNDVSREIQPVVGDFSNGDILLADPFGNIMMLYRSGTDMGDIRKDLGHLMKLSTIG